MKFTNLSLIRIIAAMLAVLAVAGSFGCKGNEESGKLDSVMDIAQFALNDGTFPEMEYEDDSVLTEVYGIDLSNVAECTVMIASDNLLADSIAVFRVRNRNYTEQLVRGLKSRLAADARVAAQYSPEQYDKINSCEVKWYGDYVFYIVNDDGLAITRHLMSRISPKLH